MFASTLLVLALSAPAIVPIYPYDRGLRTIDVDFNGAAGPPHLPSLGNVYRGNLYVDTTGNGDWERRRAVVYEDWDYVEAEGPDPTRPPGGNHYRYCELVWYKPISGPPGEIWALSTIIWDALLTPGELDLGDDVTLIYIESPPPNPNPVYQQVKVGP